MAEIQIPKPGGPLVVNEKKGDTTIVELKPWRSLIPQITKPMVASMGHADVQGSGVATGFAIITEPCDVGGPTHAHPFDQWIYLIGHGDLSEFDAEAEIMVDNVMYKIDYPFYAFMPAGMPHCPLVVKRVGKPIMFVDCRVVPEKTDK